MTHIPQVAQDPEYDSEEDAVSISDSGTEEDQDLAMSAGESDGDDGAESAATESGDEELYEQMQRDSRSTRHARHMKQKDSPKRMTARQRAMQGENAFHMELQDKAKRPKEETVEQMQRKQEVHPAPYSTSWRP